ncbi:MAG: hypothetical protein R8G34_07530 [Paracoccaceae bacterium]|nr:hypothetical protein [Paracoccaceae bacterium]
MKGFDTKTQEALSVYVYILMDGTKPFYVGKGTGNRLFDHARGVVEQDKASEKIERILQIKKEGREVGHVIVRHGLTNEEAFHVEAALIDLLRNFDDGLSNIAAGRYSNILGWRSANDIIADYAAKPLEKLHHPVVIININTSYKRGSDALSIYEVTRGDWVIGEKGRETVKFALAEYRGRIAEVFEIASWEPVFAGVSKADKDKFRWRFAGKIASDTVRDQYLNRSIAHVKTRGASNPIRYTI